MYRTSKLGKICESACAVSQTAIELRTFATNLKRLPSMSVPQQTEIKRFFATGNHDGYFTCWPGNTFSERSNCGDAALRCALIAEVMARTTHASAPAILTNINLHEFARMKFTPMVHGLFAQREQDVVLNMLVRSVVFLTPETIAGVLEKASFLSTAWTLANLYLESFDAALLSDDALKLVGYSEGTNCYVSVEYFKVSNRFDDYVVHEAAHIFHNCKRELVGLPFTRKKEWLLDIDFSKRETFAYACEAYSRIVELGDTRSGRSQLLAELVNQFDFPDDRVQIDEYVDILRQAAGARNGWKYIRERCSNS